MYQYVLQTCKLQHDLAHFHPQSPYLTLTQFYLYKWDE